MIYIIVNKARISLKQEAALPILKIYAQRTALRALISFRINTSGGNSYGCSALAI